MKSHKTISRGGVFMNPGPMSSCIDDPEFYAATA